jgi:hypothetical protein
MSRKLAKFLAGLAVVVMIPAVSQAQTCTVNVANPGPGSCDVDFNATLAVPVLAYLDVAAAGTLPLTAPVWASFLASPAPVTTVSQTAIVVRSNSNYTVNLASAAAWTQPTGAGRVLGDLTWALNETTCPAPAAITGAVSAAGTDIIAAGTPTNGNTQQLCLGLAFPGDLSDSKLLPGTYTLPLTLTITAP